MHLIAAEGSVLYKNFFFNHLHEVDPEANCRGGWSADLQYLISTPHIWEQPSLWLWNTEKYMR